MVALCGCSAPRAEPPRAVPDEAATAAADDDLDTSPGLEGEDDDDGIPDNGERTGALLGEAQRQLAAMRTSRYSHKTHVDEATGRFDYDCSGLVDYTLARVAPDALDQLRHATSKRPLAKHFVALVTSISPGDKVGRWRHVAHARDLVPGDIVAWLKPADVSTRNTGHVMIVREPVSVTQDEIAVPVIDSTSVRHGSTDSRYATESTGLGTGTIYLVVDASGSPQGYRWSHGKKAREHATTIVLARVE
jgi:hypothetical protein